MWQGGVFESKAYFCTAMRYINHATNVSTIAAVLYSNTARRLVRRAILSLACVEKCALLPRLLLSLADCDVTKQIGDTWCW